MFPSLTELLIPVIAQVPSQPTPTAPPGIEQFTNDVLSWITWIAGAVAVGAIIIIGIRMMAGQRNRSQTAADALGSLPWVFGGAILIASASGIADQFL